MRGGGKNLRFLANKSLHFSIGARSGLDYYSSLIGSRTLALDWHQIQ